MKNTDINLDIEPIEEEEKPNWVSYLNILPTAEELAEAILLVGAAYSKAGELINEEI
jgi:hypothetical protein